MKEAPGHQTPSPRARGPRLYHTKSRTGCTRCRSRRVKCNEARPVCNNCHRHDVPCEYSRPTQTPCAGSAVPVVASASPSLSTADSSLSPTPPLRLVHWEMRALHHFTVATSRTLPGSHIPRVQECWSVHVPRIALEYEPLLNALIALSALHLALTESGDLNLTDPGLLACRTAYLDAALRTHRETLGRLGPQTADAACFTSILLLIDAFAVLQSRTLEPYEPPARWLRIVQGARSVFEIAMPLVSTDPTSNIMAIIGSSAASMYDPLALFSETNLQQLPHLAQRNFFDSVDSGKLHDAELDAIYEKTTNCIGSISSAIESGEPTMALCRRLMSFACFIPPRFVELVEARTTRALILLAHFFALSTHAKELWWVGSTPEREVYAIRDEIPSSLQRLMDWPLDHLQKREAL